MALSAAKAELLGYWDFNGSYDRTGGTMGSLGVSVEGVGVDIHLDLTGEGSAINLIAPSVPDTSLRFFDLAAVVEVGHVAVAGLGLTGYGAPTISFAARNQGLFQLSDQFYVEYKIGGGNWTKADDLTAPDAPFQLITYTFLPGLLDNQPNVGIRVTFSTVATAVDTFEFDNLQINASAVPEPGALAYLAGGLGLCWVVFRKRKSA